MFVHPESGVSDTRRTGSRLVVSKHIQQALRALQMSTLSAACSAPVATACHSRPPLNASRPSVAAALSSSFPTGPTGHRRTVDAASMCAGVLCVKNLLACSDLVRMPIAELNGAENIPNGWNWPGGMAPICSSMAVKMMVLRAVSCSTTCTGHCSGFSPYRFARSCIISTSEMNCPA